MAERKLPQTVEVDLTNYVDTRGGRVSEDWHEVRIVAAERVNSQADNPMINVWYRILGGEFDGATVIDRLVITEKALWRVVGFLAAIKEKTNGKIKINAANLKGKRLAILAKDDEEYKGRIKSSVADYREAGDIRYSDVEAVPDDLSGLEEFAPEDSEVTTGNGDGPESAPPVQIGTQESIGPLGDQVRAANSERLAETAAQPEQISTEDVNVDDL